MSHHESDWFGLYGEGWQDEIVKDSFSHPAKYSRALIRHIYRHAIDEGWLKAGDVVIDPFGGCGLGGIDAANNGIRFIGVELEKFFVILSHRNYEMKCRKEWCVCGAEGGAYLRSMRKTLSERVDRLSQNTETKDGSILQSGLLEQLSLQGKGFEPRTCGETEGENTLEQGKEVAGGNEIETVDSCQQWESSNGEEWKMEGREIHSTGRIYSSPSGNQTGKDGTRSHDGESLGQGAEREGDCPSQERESTGQPDREPGSDDDFGTHAAASSQRDSEKDSREDVSGLRDDLFGEVSTSPVQRVLQESETTRTLGTTQKKEKGKFCKKCGKLTVPFPIVLQGDSRKLCEVLRESAAGAISSPPYADTPTIASGAQRNEANWRAGKSLSEGKPQGYGDTPGQLGAMPAGQVDAVTSSPPYEEGLGHISRNPTKAAIEAGGSNAQCIYSGENPDNVGDMRGETFWGAARQIVEQVHQILKPGGHAIWVVKDFVKTKRRVEFCRQWQSLCESVGFETLHVHRAWVVENHGVQEGIFGTTKEHVKSRKSFFRRLCEKHGSPAIDFEEVICMIKNV